RGGASVPRPAPRPPGVVGAGGGGDARRADTAARPARLDRKRPLLHAPDAEVADELGESPDWRGWLRWLSDVNQHFLDGVVPVAEPGPLPAVRLRAAGEGPRPPGPAGPAPPPPSPEQPPPPPPLPPP